MEFTILKRKEKLDFFKIFNFSLLKKTNVLGEGGQGKVYKMCVSEGRSSKCIAVKKFYLEKKDSKYLETPFNIKSFSYANFIELASSKLINQLILQKICPNYILNYDWSYKERSGICDDIYPYTVFHYNEIIEDSLLYTDWVKQKNTLNEFYNAYFQIIVGIYNLQKYFKMTHLDLHSDNIIVKKVKKGGCWKYIIGDDVYYLPNLGYVFLINDFGHAFIPKYFKSSFIKYDYKNTKITNVFDIQHLFKSTLDISTSSNTFKNIIKINIIKNIKKDIYSLPEAIYSTWYDKYKTKTGKIIDTFDTNIKLNKEDIPKKLRGLVTNN